MEQRGGEGLAEFLDAQVPRLLALARLLTDDEPDAVALTRVALVRVGAHWSEVREGFDPQGYARRTLLARYLSPLQRWRRSRRERPPAPHPGLLAGLSALPPRQRAVLVLRHHEDLPPDEVGEQLGSAEATVATELDRARATLGVDGAAGRTTADLTAGLRELAAGPPPTGLADQVLSDLRTRRRRGLVAVAVLVVAGILVAYGISTTGTDDHRTEDPAPTRGITLPPGPPLQVGRFPQEVVGWLARHGVPTRPAGPVTDGVDAGRAIELAWFGTGLPAEQMEGAAARLRVPTTIEAPRDLRGRPIWVVWIPLATPDDMGSYDVHPGDPTGRWPYVCFVDAATGEYRSFGWFTFPR